MLLLPLPNKSTVKYSLESHPRSILQPQSLSLLYEAMQDKSAELCLIFHSTHSVLYFPLENIVQKILLCIHCNKPVKVPLTLVHYGKYCTRAWSRG